MKLGDERDNQSTYHPFISAFLRQLGRCISRHVNLPSRLRLSAAVSPRLSRKRWSLAGLCQISPSVPGNAKSRNQDQKMASPASGIVTPTAESAHSSRGIRLPATKLPSSKRFKLIEWIWVAIFENFVRRLQRLSTVSATINRQDVSCVRSPGSSRPVNALVTPI